MDKLIHSRIEALALGTTVHRLFLLLVVVGSGAEAVIFQHQALNFRVILKWK